MPVPILGWDAPRDVWLAARRAGLGASEVGAALGLSRHSTPWEVWADKTGVMTGQKSVTEAMSLGTDLEPWLLEQAPKLIGHEVARTPHQLYAHDGAPWRLCSPDGFASDGGLVEAKTAGLAGWADAAGWADGGLPLAYEFQARWQMHVMDRQRVYVVALVAGMGRVVRVVERSIMIELDLVSQVTHWWTEHIINGVEPPMGAGDVEALTHMYPIPDKEIVRLDHTDIVELVYAYRAHRETETEACTRKKEVGAEIKALLGGAHYGVVADQPVASWGPVKGDVDYRRMAEDLAEKAGIDLPDPELYRKPSSRSLKIK